MNIRVCIEIDNLKLNVSLSHDKKQAMSDKGKSWTDAAADSIKQTDEAQARRSEMLKRQSEIIKAKGSNLWQSLCAAMQADIDAFNARLANNDPRRLRMAIKSNFIIASRLNDYPLVELVAELRLEAFHHEIAYFYRRRSSDGERLSEFPLAGVKTESVIFTIDNAENVYFSHDGQPKKVEEISELLLSPLPTAR